MKKTIILTGLLLICSLLANLFDTTPEKGTLLPKSYSAPIKTDSYKPKKELFDSDLLKQISLSGEVTYVEREIYDVLYKGVKGTVYHAVKSQTDDTPFLTADNSFIDTARVNELRWVALSRDLLNRKFRDRHGNKYVWSGKIKLGDTIWVDYDKKELWRITHANSKQDIVSQAKADLRYEKMKKKYEQVKGYWIVHDVMGKQYTKRNRKGEYILDENGNKQIVKITNAIDFLQHPELGMLDVWDRNIIIAKRRVETVTLPLLAMN